jgi:diguanylate cyclase (GGDEF)-like protein/PAS domain S-box-containing protein
LSYLAAIVESSEDAIIGLTFEGIITTWNFAAQRAYGHSAPEMVGNSISVLLPGRLAEDELMAALRRVAAGEYVEITDAKRRRKDGTVVDVSLRVSPIRDELGDVVGVSSHARDVTASRNVQTALRGAEEMLRRAFEEAPIGMAMVVPNGRFQRVNDAFCELIGYSRAELMAMSPQAITHPDDLAGEEEEIRRAVAGETEGYRAEKRYLHASGRVVWVSQQASLLRDGAGDPLRLLVQAQDITDRRRYEDRLRHLAEHDALTGLLNRASFGRELEAHRMRTGRYGIDGAAVVLDLDQFKFVNDTLGHSAGDQAITRAANALRSRLRETDMLARLGGDEFGVLLPHADAETALLVTNGLLEALRAETVELGGRARSLTGSAGIALFDEKTTTGEDVLVNADLAMYDAKNSGRDQVAVFKTGTHDQSQMKGRITWAERIGGALEADAFVLMTQPIVDLATGEVTQHELLLRLRDEHDDLIPPGAFLYIAERLGMIGEIDRWVTRRAIELIAARHVTGDELTLEVNVSGLSIGDPELLTLISDELTNTGVPPDRLVFEITETAAVTNIINAGRFAQSLAALGCRFALDDFGAGYGSFYYLKHLPFDYLKIDGDFVKSATTSETDRLLIKAVVDIATGMGKKTIAEYVGDQKTVELLTRLGVDYGQGFHLGRPMPLLGPTATRSAAPTSEHSARPLSY